jgi:hypothetical protein
VTPPAALDSKADPSYFVFQSSLEDAMTQVASPSPDDIAYVRQLAESGARAPLIGGRFMAWWGLALTIAYAVHYFALRGAIGDGRTIFAIIWFGFAVAGVTGQLVLARGMPAKAGAGSAGNRASRSVWMAGAFAIASMSIGAAIAAETGQGYQTFDWIVPVAFAAYSCALIVTGSLAGERIAVVAGYGAVVMVGLFTSLIQHPDRYLLAAAGVAATVLLPGIVLMLREPKSEG